MNTVRKQKQKWRGHLSKQKRLQIVRMHSEGRTRAQICRTVRCCDATVKRIIDLYRLHKDVEDRPRAPHKGPRKLRALQEELLIVAAIVDEPFLTLRELKKELNLSVTRNTVLRRLKQHGLICLNNSTCRNLTGWMKSARLSFARVHLAWTAAQWQKVVFTNESTICCKWDPNKNYLGRERVDHTSERNPRIHSVPTTRRTKTAYNLSYNNAPPRLVGP
uniref:Putative transposable element n=1 Tax=Ixodes ricinus TaxID=34613 RepID=A0A0K8RKS5_IXORI